MPVSEQCTGPVAVWAGVPVVSQANPPNFGSQNAAPSVQVTTIVPAFFGWGEMAPEPEFMPEYENIMSDLGGSRKPHDKLYEGSDARVTGTFTLFDEAILQAMLAVTRTSPPGVDGAFDTGTIMHAEKRSFQLWLVYPYQRRAFMQAANIKKGYHFYGAMIDGPVRRKQGTSVNKVSVSWYCGRPIINGVYLCYDFFMDAVFNLPTNLNGRF